MSEKQREMTEEEVVEKEPIDERVQDETTQDQRTEELEKKAELSDEEKQVSEKEEESALNRLIRLQADFENFKKRTQKEKLESYQFAGESMAKKLLPVLDDLERAQASLEASGDQAKAYAEGVSMVFNHLKDVLKEEGLEEIACDVSFDPNLHHGVVAEDHPEKEDQDILEVFQKGYCFRGKLIRPSMVKVCKK